MKRVLFLLMAAFVLAAYSKCAPAYAGNLHAQTGSETQNRSPNQPTSLSHGIVVDEIQANTEAEKSGIKAGDILQGWTRGDAHGDIASPFDLVTVETEQAPRGSVTLQGLHGDEAASWTIGSNTWGIVARPDFPPSQLAQYQQGQTLLKAGKADDAANAWRKMAGSFENTAPSRPFAKTWLLFHAAESLAADHQWKGADDTYRQSLDQLGTDDDANRPVRIRLLRAWAAQYKIRDDASNADKYLQLALVESRKSGPETFTTVTIFDSLSGLAERLDDLTKAEEYGSQVLSISEKLAPDSLPVAQGFNRLGNAAWKRGELQKAEGYYLRSLEIRQKLAPDSLAVAASLSGLGLVTIDRDLAKAEGYYTRALALYEKLAPGSSTLSGGYYRMARVAWEHGNLAKAEAYLRKVLAIDEKLSPESHDVADALLGLGNVTWKRGDLASAENYFQRSLIILQKLAPDSLTVASVEKSLGNISAERQKYDAARESYKRALDIELKLAPGSLDSATTINNIGESYREGGDAVNAEKYFREALAIEEKIATDSRNVADSLFNIGKLAQQRGDLAEAERCYRRTSAIFEHMSPGSWDTAVTLAALADVLAEQHQPNEAQQLYERAMAALEAQSAQLGGSDDVRADFRAKYSSISRDYIAVLLTQKQPELAMQVAERSRAQSLLEMLTAARVDIHQGTDPPLLQRERDLRQSLNAKSDARLRLLSDQHTEEQLTALNKEMDELLLQRKDLQSQIRLSSPAYAALTQPQPLSVKDVQQLLDSDSVLLEYSLGENHSYLWAVTTDTLTSYELPGRAEIEIAVRKAYELLTARNRTIKGETELQRDHRLAKADAAYPAAIAALSNMLIAPAIAQLGTKRLVVVSDGALQYIPFSMLPVPSSTAGNDKSTSKAVTHSQPMPLIAEHEVVNLPSASVLAVLRQEALGRRPAPKMVAVFADPVFDDRDTRVASAKAHVQDTSQYAYLQPSEALTRSAADVGLSSADSLHLARLPFSRREAKAILATVPQWQGMAALDFMANRATATSSDLAQYRIVHFATHGLVDSEHPEFSGLVLSLVDEQGKPQNGFLQLQDIYNLSLPVDMVVLSACETGLGRQIDSEGLDGLTRGFMYAGATRVVASLWKVDDAATAELMSRFYRAMEQDGLRPAAALRRAQVEMSKQQRWASPYNWAGFQIQGEWR